MTLTVLARTNVLQALRGTTGDVVGAKAFILRRLIENFIRQGV